MRDSTVRFSTFPRTEPPPAFVLEMVDIFRTHKDEISTESLAKGLKSDEVLKVLEPQLSDMGFEIEVSKKKVDKVQRPVFFGENGTPALRYEIDAYHPQWKCGLEIEAGRSWMGDAVYRDLIQAAVMVGVSFLCIAVPNAYKFQNAGKQVTSKDYEKANQLAEAIYGLTRFHLPYGLAIIGY